MTNLDTARELALSLYASGDLGTDQASPIVGALKEAAQAIAQLTQERDQARTSVQRLARRADILMGRAVALLGERDELRQECDELRAEIARVAEERSRYRATRDEARAALQLAAQWIGTLDISYWDESPLGEIRAALWEE